MRVVVFSHGFLRLEVMLSELWPSRTVSGMSLMPGTGTPSAIIRHKSAKDAGAGASPYGDKTCVLLCALMVVSCGSALLSANGSSRASSQASYGSIGTVVPNFLYGIHLSCETRRLRWDACYEPCIEIALSSSSKVGFFACVRSRGLYNRAQTSLKLDVIVPVVCSY